MKLPWKNDDTTEAEEPEGSAASDDATDDGDGAGTGAKGSAFTAGKGRPTPSRREAEARRRGPVAPPPTSRSEARARKKELRSSATKADRKASADERRRQRVEQREKMMEGDERYLMPRDKGEVRRFARNVVDSRRNFAGLFMPFAILLIVVMFVPQIAVYANLVLLVFVLFMAIDGYILGRIVNRRVRERFPNADASQTGLRLGWYAFTRALQLRRMRAPKPQVSPGDKV